MNNMKLVGGLFNVLLEPSFVSSISLALLIYAIKCNHKPSEFAGKCDSEQGWWIYKELGNEFDTGLGSLTYHGRTNTILSPDFLQKLLHCRLLFKFYD